MSIANMMTAANLPVGDKMSLFKNPASTNLDDLNNIADLCFALSPGIDFSNIVTLTSDINDHMATKVVSVTTHVPLAVAMAEINKRISDIDSALINVPTTLNSNPYPNVGAAFQTLTEIGSILASATTLIIGRMNAANLQPLYNVTGVSSTDELVTMMRVPAKKSAIITAANTVTDSLNTVITGIKGSIDLAIAASVFSFESLRKAEIEAMEEIMRTITNFHFIGSLADPTPYIKEIHDAIINTDNLDNKAVIAIASNQPTLSDLANQQLSYPSTDLADFTQDVTCDMSCDSSTIPNTSPTTDHYEKFVIEAWTYSLKIEKQALDFEYTQCQQIVEDNLRWKISTNYTKFKTEAGYSTENPEGTTNDPTLKSQWVALLYEQRARTKKYLDDYYDPFKYRLHLYDKKKQELNRRVMWGKKYATSITQQTGRIWNEGEATTYWDTTT
jgi:hypothetical protein